MNATPTSAAATPIIWRRVSAWPMNIHARPIATAGYIEPDDDHRRDRAALAAVHDRRHATGTEHAGEQAPAASPTPPANGRCRVTDAAPSSEHERGRIVAATIGHVPASSDVEMA